jgi:anti-anti-sigma factor
MSDLARFDLQRDGSVSMVRVIGEVDISNAPELFAALEAAVPNGDPTLVVDLTETTYLDSAGVQLLFVVIERLHARRQQVRVIVPEDSPIRAVLEITGLPQLVPLESRLAES